MINDDASKIAPVLAELKENYLNHQTKELKFRKQQLKNLITGLKESEKELNAAYLSDLGYKNPGLTKLFNILPTIMSFEHTLANLHDWVKPRHVKTSLLLGNGSSKVLPEPLGVALVMGTWNYPLITSIQPVGEAIAAGNCVVLKPSELAPQTSNLFRKIFEKYLDQRYYRVIEGGVNVAKNICTHRWDLIIYTGSPQKGKLVAKAAAENLIPVILELGGKCPAIVDETADIQNAVARLGCGKFTNCGQTCLAPDFLYVHESISDKLIEQLKKKLKEFYGENAEENEDYSRIIAPFHTERFAKMIDQVKNKIVYGGKYDVQKRFVEPTVVLNPPKDSLVMEEEIFGPILPIITYRDFNREIMSTFGKLEKPLALYYFGSNKQRIQALETETSSGSFVVNDAVIQIANNELPFGGVGMSGFQKLHGIFGFDNCSNLKAVLYKDTYNGFPMHVRFPPFDKNKKSLLNTLKPFLGIQNEDLKAGIAFLLVSLVILGFVFAKQSNEQ